MGTVINSPNEKAHSDLQREWDHLRRSVGTKKAVDSFMEHNAQIDASKARDRKRTVEQQVSNTYLSGVRFGFTFPKCEFLEREKEGIAKPPSGKYRFGMKDGQSVLLSWPSQLTPAEIEIAKRYYNCV